MSLPEASSTSFGFSEEGFNFNVCKVDDSCMIRMRPSSGYNTSECDNDVKDWLCKYCSDHFDYSLYDAEISCQVGDGICNREMHIKKVTVARFLTIGSVTMSVQLKTNA